MVSVSSHASAPQSLGAELACHRMSAPTRAAEAANVSIVFRSRTPAGWDVAGGRKAGYAAATVAETCRTKSNSWGPISSPSAETNSFRSTT
jgi:hypothetical protein